MFTTEHTEFTEILKGFSVRSVVSVVKRLPRNSSLIVESSGMPASCQFAESFPIMKRNLFLPLIVLLLVFAACTSQSTSVPTTISTSTSVPADIIPTPTLNRIEQAIATQKAAQPDEPDTLSPATGISLPEDSLRV